MASIFVLDVLRRRSQWPSSAAEWRCTTCAVLAAAVRLRDQSPRVIYVSIRREIALKVESTSGRAIVSSR